MTFKRPISYSGTAVIDAENNVIAHTYEEYIAARIADALTNYAPAATEKQISPPIQRAEWDGWIRFESDCIVDGYPVKAGTSWGPFEKSRSTESPSATIPAATEKPDSLKVGKCANEGICECDLPQCLYPGSPCVAVPSETPRTDALRSKAEAVNSDTGSLWRFVGFLLLNHGELELELADGHRTCADLLRVNAELRAGVPSARTRGIEAPGCAYCMGSGNVAPGEKCPFCEDVLPINAGGVHPEKGQAVSTESHSAPGTLHAPINDAAPGNTSRGNAAIR